MKMAENKMDVCDAEDQSGRIPISSPSRRDDRSPSSAAIETTLSLGMIPPRKINPSHEPVVAFEITLSLGVINGSPSRKIKPNHEPAAAAIVDTTLSLGVIKGSPSRKRNPNHESAAIENTRVIKRSPSRKRNPNHKPAAAVDTTLSLGLMKRSPSRKREEEEEEEEETHEGNPNNGHTEEEGREARKFHPKIYEGIVYGPAFLFKKKLWSWDVATDQNRLVFTGRYNCFVIAVLRAKEMREAMDEFLRVVTTDQNGVEYTLGIKWVRKAHTVLTNEWSKLVRANGLKKGDFIQLYCYRVGPDEELRLAIHVIPKK